MKSRYENKPIFMVRLEFKSLQSRLSHETKPMLKINVNLKFAHRTTIVCEPMSEAIVTNSFSNIGLIPVFDRRANTRFAPTLVFNMGLVSVFVCRRTKDSTGASPKIRTFNFFALKGWQHTSPGQIRKTRKISTPFTYVPARCRGEPYVRPRTNNAFVPMYDGRT